MIPLPAPISMTSQVDVCKTRPSSGPGGSQQASTRSCAAGAWHGRGLVCYARSSEARGVE